MGFINFIFRWKCHFLAARASSVRGGGERKAAKKKGNGCSPRAAWYKSPGAPSLYAIYDTFFKRANIRQRGNSYTGRYEPFRDWPHAY